MVAVRTGFGCAMTERCRDMTSRSSSGLAPRVGEYGRFIWNDRPIADSYRVGDDGTVNNLRREKVARVDAWHSRANARP